MSLCLFVLMQARAMNFWFPAPLPTGQEAQRKLRPEHHAGPGPEALEGYVSDSSVEADNDSDKEGHGGAEAASEASAPPGRRTRAATAKIPASKAAAQAEQAWDAKADNKRKRGNMTPPVILVPTSVEIPVEEEDEITDELWGDDVPPRSRSPSPATKRHRELQAMTEDETLRRALEAQRAAAAAQVGAPAVKRGRRLLAKSRLM